VNSRLLCETLAVKRVLCFQLSYARKQSFNVRRFCRGAHSSSLPYVHVRLTYVHHNSTDQPTYCNGYFARDVRFLIAEYPVGNHYNSSANYLLIAALRYVQPRQTIEMTDSR
jgi:hypothetical protein